MAGRWLLLAFLPSLLIGCMTTDDDADCGNSVQADFEVGATPLSNAVRGANGYSWLLSVQGACPKEHAAVHVDVTMAAENPDPEHCSIVVLSGDVAVSAGGSGYPITFGSPQDFGDEVIYKGNANVGLAQSFGDGPGNFIAEVVAGYAMTSDAAADLECVSQWIHAFSFDATYHEYKAPRAGDDGED